MRRFQSGESGILFSLSLILDELFELFDFSRLERSVPFQPFFRAAGELAKAPVKRCT